MVLLESDLWTPHNGACFDDSGSAVTGSNCCYIDVFDKKCLAQIRLEKSLMAISDKRIMQRFGCDFEVRNVFSVNGRDVVKMNGYLNGRRKV